MGAFRRSVMAERGAFDNSEEGEASSRGDRGIGAVGRGWWDARVAAAHRSGVLTDVSAGWDGRIGSCILRAHCDANWQEIRQVSAVAGWATEGDAVAVGLESGRERSQHGFIDVEMESEPPARCCH